MSNDKLKDQVRVRRDSSSSSVTHSKPIKLTREQQQAISMFLSKENLKVNAYAGTGKTSTLRAMAKEARRKGLYLAFNRSIADYAREVFPHNVECRTTNSLAFNAVKRRYDESSGKLTNKLTAFAVADQLRLKDIKIEDTLLPARSFGYLVLETCRRFLYSDSTEINPEFVSLTGKLRFLSYTNSIALKSLIAEQTLILWQHMCNPHSKIALGHDGYVKVWALEKPVLNFDFIMLDEAQDTSPVLLDVLEQQKCQIVYVGDRHQQIYQWRGAVNAMDRLPFTKSAELTQSFRFGEEIADLANSLLTHLDETSSIIGNPSIKSSLYCDNPQVVICRTNANMIAELVRGIEHDFKLSLLGGTDELLRLLKGVEELQLGKASNYPDLFGFKSWDEVLEYAQTNEGASALPFVPLIKSYGVAKLLNVLKASQNEDQDAELIVTTAHKAKGCEWDRVELSDDFLRVKRTDEGVPIAPSEEEYRIAYVALTRAKQNLHVPPKLLDFIRGAQNIPAMDHVDKSADFIPKSISVWERLKELFS
jgi:superfamily I DNA/RNA helicase